MLEVVLQVVASQGDNAASSLGFEAGAACSSPDVRGSELHAS